MPQQMAKGSTGARTRSYTGGSGNVQGAGGGGAGGGFLLGGSLHGGKKRKDVGFDSLKVVNMAVVREVTTRCYGNYFRTRTPTDRRHRTQGDKVAVPWIALFVVRYSGTRPPVTRSLGLFILSMLSIRGLQGANHQRMSDVGVHDAIVDRHMSHISRQ